ncbi:hypothetical protein [Sorangium sp. So ce204]|uniref:hypothetical protein n=1 Tax=Sorangium sp. So ce204 TaxID=3133288 RepID=UPI003F603868
MGIDGNRRDPVRSWRLAMAAPRVDIFRLGDCKTPFIGRWPREEVAMACHLEESDKLVWIEIEGGGTEPRKVRCPRRAATVDARECFACPRYATLAIHPSGKKVYLVCEPFDEEPSEPS